MTDQSLAPATTAGAIDLRPLTSRSSSDVLHALAVSLGCAWAAAFILAGLAFELQLYGDGSIFSYAVAVEESWTYHWHNISGRIFVFLLAHWPAEVYVGLTGDAPGGIVLHGLLFFGAQAVGLALTFIADGSRGRVLFRAACISNAVLLPLVFGFPTEMWIAHAAFWPTLAAAHYLPAGWRATFAVTFGIAAMVLSHGGGVVLALTVLATTMLRGWRGPQAQRVALALAVAAALLATVLWRYRPDPYIASVIATAAFCFIDLRNLLAPAAVEIWLALAGFGALAIGLRPLLRDRAVVTATIVVGVALVGYWLLYDVSVLTDYRYPLRTALLVFTPPLGLFASGLAIHEETALMTAWPQLARMAEEVRGYVTPRHLIGALLLVTAIHVVETTKFVVAWRHYVGAVRSLSMGTAADPALGHPQFVSAARLSDDLNRLSWSSTTHFLSVLTAPGLSPRRLVMSPSPEYWWLTCARATGNLQAVRAVPKSSRALIRDYACSH